GFYRWLALCLSFQALRLFYEFRGEYKVITGNYKAEYGQVSSAAVTAATKSGTNEFKGEAFYRYTNDSMRAMTPAERQPGKSKEDSAEKEYG
ncbi:hypothetical protein NSX61_25175, partial [Salmonella enterica]|nr:hypothetical protein [Salmonella enterica]